MQHAACSMHVCKHDCIITVIPTWVLLLCCRYVIWGLELICDNINKLIKKTLLQIIRKLIK